MPDQSQERDDDPALTKMLGALPGERLFSRRDDVSTSPAVEEPALSERVEEMRDLAERARLRAENQRLRDALGLLRGYVVMGSEGWDIINAALAGSPSQEAK